ncbi:MAG: hypothetical protein LAQ30_25790 [Acidobacteriia bacterium]|nr:hypothetical protein [Terriglobia bacterium]
MKTTGQATPALLQRGNEGEAAGAGIPSWSPTGEWIAVGKGMISADGKSRRSWGEHGSSHSMFSADGKLVYGIRPEGERNLLFSLDIATGVEKAIGDLGRDAAPATPLTSGIRFSLAPDGKSFVYAAARQTTSIWLLEGFTQKAGLLARLGLR